MVSAAALEKMGGWRTQTISEDLEMSVQLAMAEVKIWWVPLAITYDEQPLSYEISVKQRRRWTSGTIQIAHQYLPVIMERMMRKPDSVVFDMGATMLVPAYQVAALGSW